MLVGAIRDGEKMRWDFITPLAQVHLDHGVGVDGVADVGVDDHAEEAGVGLQG